jgi:hypothetical protein
MVPAHLGQQKTLPAIARSQLPARIMVTVPQRGN